MVTITQVSMQTSTVSCSFRVFVTINSNSIGRVHCYANADDHGAWNLCSINGTWSSSFDALAY